MTSVFLIGGFNIHHTIAQSEKIKLLQGGLEAKGYHVIMADISWRQKTPSQFAAEFKELYKAHSTAHNIIVGNSFGAVVALCVAPDLVPDQMYLCSLSAFFSEDRAERSDSDDIKHFGKRRMRDLWSLSFNEIIKKYDNLDIDVTITYGEMEKKMHPLLVRGCERAAALLPRAKLVELPGAPHSMNDPVYTRELLEYIPNATHFGD